MSMLYYMSSTNCQFCAKIEFLPSPHELARYPIYIKTHEISQAMCMSLSWFKGLKKQWKQKRSNQVHGNNDKPTICNSCEAKDSFIKAELQVSPKSLPEKIVKRINKASRLFDAGYRRRRGSNAAIGGGSIHADAQRNITFAYLYAIPCLCSFGCLTTKVSEV